ncbi:MAG TPA: OB-fold domain-containing protein [Bordetella sp.]|nr:OB-fold domain-containing protein [Bordetella sp.]
MKPELPTPTVPAHGDGLVQEFLDAAAQGRLLMRWCCQCERAHWYPRSICPLCFSDRTQWRGSAGTGTIYTYSIMRRANPPYAIAYVRLDENVTMMTNIVAPDLDTIRIGQRVSAVFNGPEVAGGLPVFEPVPAPA